MNRATRLELMKVAGYHDDRAGFTRLFVEGRVSMMVANERFRTGAKMKSNGVKCSCIDCNPKVKP
jgi:hypothetical protein